MHVSSRSLLLAALPLAALLLASVSPVSARQAGALPPSALASPAQQLRILAGLSEVVAVARREQVSASGKTAVRPAAEAGQLTADLLPSSWRPPQALRAHHTETFFAGPLKKGVTDARPWAVMLFSIAWTPQSYAGGKVSELRPVFGKGYQDAAVLSGPLKGGTLRLSAAGEGWNLVVMSPGFKF